MVELSLLSTKRPRSVRFAIFHFPDLHCPSPPVSSRDPLRDTVGGPHGESFGVSSRGLPGGFPSTWENSSRDLPRDPPGDALGQALGTSQGDLLEVLQGGSRVIPRGDPMRGCP